MTLAATLALIVVLGEWTGIARALLGSPAFAAVLDVSAIAVAGFAILRGGWRPFRPVLLDALVVALAILALVEIANPNVPSPIAGAEGYRKTAFTIIGYVIVRASGEWDARRFISIFAVGTVPAALFALRQFVAPSALDLAIISSAGTSPISFHSGPVLRGFSPTPGPFHLGVIGAAALLAAIGLARFGRRRWLVVAGAGAVALAVSITRANIIGAVCGAAAMIGLEGWNRIGSRHGRRLVAIVLAAGAGIACFFLLGLIVGLIDVAAAARLLPGIGTDRSFGFRLGYWAEFARAVAAQPLIGYGTSAAADGFARLYAGTGSANFEPHSIYFKAALELGIGGLVLLLAVLATASAYAFRLSRARPDLSIVVFGVIILLAVSGLSGPMLDAYPFNLFFWSLLGWIAGAYARRDGDTTQPATDEGLWDRP